tara:strand:- start:459 stop:1391 length:933 start_codon:yes stop_codon:yes gene_type:complete
LAKKSKQRTALIIGRWQPWHQGHKELFKAALERAERVAIGVRSTHATDEKNPFSFEEVCEFINKDLEKDYKGKYEIVDLPNITNVIYGRDVGYTVEKVSFDKNVEAISATKIRKSMNITPVKNEVSAQERNKRNSHLGGVVWLTGLSASGKTTIASKVERKLFDKGYNIYMLDGDNLRDGLNSNLGFTDQDRNENIRRASEVANILAESGFIVIASFISPFEKDRKLARSRNKTEFYEVFISASIQECEDRDPKGLYKKARKGEIKNFTGISSQYEEPNNPDIIIDTEKLSEMESSNFLSDFIEKKFPKH